MCAESFFEKLLKQGQDSSMLSENATSSGIRSIITRFVDKNLADIAHKHFLENRRLKYQEKVMEKKKAELQKELGG